jgi:hypothetical protein
MGKSHQSGWVVLRGKKWYGYHRRTVLDPITNERKTYVVSHILGLKSQLTKGVAREALQKEIAKQTGQNLGGRIKKDGSVTFGWFVRNRDYPLRDWRPETEKVKKIQIERDLVEKFDSVSQSAFFGIDSVLGKITGFCNQTSHSALEFRIELSAVQRSLPPGHVVNSAAAC